MALHDPVQMKQIMQDMIADELERLRRQADVSVFALYDANRPNEGPVDFHCVERDDVTAHPPPISLDFDGIGIWYFAYRSGETFWVRKILLQISRNRFVHGEVGEFEGFWEDFPTYVAEDRWVQSIVRKTAPANDPTHGGSDPSEDTNGLAGMIATKAGRERLMRALGRR